VTPEIERTTALEAAIAQLPPDNVSVTTWLATLVVDVHEVAPLVIETEAPETLKPVGNVTAIVPAAANAPVALVVKLTV
jgi:hypothetical protein